MTADPETIVNAAALQTRRFQIADVVGPSLVSGRVRRIRIVEIGSNGLTSFWITATDDGILTVRRADPIGNGPAAGETARVLGTNAPVDPRPGRPGLRRDRRPGHRRQRPPGARPVIALLVFRALWDRLFPPRPAWADVIDQQAKMSAGILRIAMGKDPSPDDPDAPPRYPSEDPFKPDYPGLKDSR